MKSKRDGDGIPILPSYDDQLRVIIVGEAGVDKSYVQRSLMWFSFQHGWAESIVITLHQGRPVLNYSNLVFRGMTSCMLHELNARTNNSEKNKYY
jgi:hypothetical protein